MERSRQKNNSQQKRKTRSSTKSKNPPKVVAKPKKKRRIQISCVNVNSSDEGSEWEDDWSSSDKDESSHSGEESSFLGNPSRLFDIRNPYTLLDDEDDYESQHIESEMEDFVVRDDDNEDEGANLYYNGLGNAIDVVNAAAHFMNSTEKITRAKAKKEEGVILPKEEVEPEITKEEESHGKSCRICLTRTTKTTILECGHSIMCIACSRTIGGAKNPKCPVCNKPIKAIIRIYSN